MHLGLMKCLLTKTDESRVPAVHVSFMNFCLLLYISGWTVYQFKCETRHFFSCPDVLMCFFVLILLLAVFNQRPREHLNFSGMQLRVKLLFFFIPLTPFRSLNILSPWNNQESEIGFVPPSVWGIIIVWITNAAGLVSLRPLVLLRTVPERRQAKNKSARHSMIK